MARGLVVVLGLFALLCLSASSVHAWGSDGHKIVAQIAQTFLTPTALAAVQKQLPPGDSLADIATLPDSYDHNSGGGWSSDLHYVDLPDNATYFQVFPACEAGCVVTAIFNYSSILYKSRGSIQSGLCTTSTTAEPCALSFLTHFLGDVHQPMHVSYSSDKGGNGFSVTFFNSSTNLHSVWDSSMISKYEGTLGGGWQNFATDLINILKANPAYVQLFANETNPSRWANESFVYTQQVCYNFMPGTVPIPLSWPKPRQDPPAFDLHAASPRSVASTCGPAIGYPYYDRNIVIVQQRLAAGGIRLATLLNDIYASSASTSARWALAMAAMERSLF